MEQQGWVVRLRDLPDRRAIRLQLTDVGHRVLLDATAVGDAALTELFAGVRPAELGLLTRLLGRAYEQAIAIRGAQAPAGERGSGS
jgi:DNA-binding MarR family transcriptional regulator